MEDCAILCRVARNPENIAMAFPFRSPARPSVHTLRQRILVAIGSGGLAALSPFGVFGCGSSAIDDQPSSMAGSGHAGVTGGGT